MQPDVLELDTRVPPAIAPAGPARLPSRDVDGAGQDVRVPRRGRGSARRRVRTFVAAHAVALSCVLAVAIRAPGFTAPLGNDEAGFALVGSAWLTGATGPAGPQLYGAYWLDRPPLTPLLYGAADLAGGAVGVRLLGVLAAVLVVAGCGALAARIGGRRAGALAAVLAAALTSSPVLLADRAYGELVAAAATVWSVMLLHRVFAHGGPSDRASWRQAPPSAWLAGASGFLACVGVLVKQSALDAVAVGGVVCLVLAVRSGTRGHALAWGAGVLAPVAATCAWAVTMSTGLADLYEALVGFRVDVLAARSSSATVVEGWAQLVQPLALSGLAMLVPLAVLGVASARGRSAVLLCVWSAACVVGVLGGGYNWSHYLIQLPRGVGERW